MVTQIGLVALLVGAGDAIGAAVGLNVQDGLAGMIPTEEASAALAVPPTPAATIAAE